MILWKIFKYLNSKNWLSVHEIEDFAYTPLLCVHVHHAYEMDSIKLQAECMLHWNIPGKLINL